MKNNCEIKGNYRSLCIGSMTPGFTRNSSPIWARGQDAFLVIRRLRVQSQPAAIVCEPRFATETSFASYEGLGNLLIIYTAKISH